MKAGLEGISDDEAFAEIQVRRFGGAKTDKPVKVAELETLVASKDEVGEDRPEGSVLRTCVTSDGLGPPVDGAD